MPANRRISRVLDEHCFDALAASVAPGPAGTALMFMDRDLRVRGLNGPYEAISLRQRNEMLGCSVAELFPDNPHDPQASGLELLAASVEAALGRNGTDVMPIMRYDITAPHDPNLFLPNVWTARNIAVHDGYGPIGVLHQVTEITSLDQALSALALTSAGGRAFDAPNDFTCWPRCPPSLGLGWAMRRRWNTRSNNSTARLKRATSSGRPRAC